MFRKSMIFLSKNIKLDLADKFILCRIDLVFKNFLVPNIFKHTIDIVINSFSLSRYVGHLYLAIFSVSNILRIKFMTIKTAQYLIDIKNSDGYYDFRSKEILEIVPPKESANFIHINNLKYSLQTLFQKSNVIYFESIYEVAKPFLKKQRFECVKVEDDFVNKLLEVYQNHYSDSYYIFKIVKFMLKFLNIHQFISLDDSRYSNELNLACKELGIKTIGYMHGRFNEYHLGLFEFPFDQYLVWSEYFKNMLLTKSDKYKKENIEVVGHFRIKKQKEFVSRNKNILWLGESNVDFYEILPYIEMLIKKDYRIIFRGKPGANSSLSDVLIKNKIILDDSNDFFTCLENHNIGVVVGTHSTALMESWIVGVPSFAVECSYDYGRHLWEDGLIELCASIQIIDKIVNKYFEMKYEDIKHKQREIWGAKYWYDEQKVQKILKA